MQKIEYTCDRCGRRTPAERMSKLELRFVFIKPTSSKKGLEAAEEILDGLQRSFKDHLDRDLCDNCAVALQEWLEKGTNTK